MPKTNAQNVRAYYERNKSLVLFRKAMKRCREAGTVPTLETVRENDFPLQALFVAFAEWAGSTPCKLKVRKQHAKLLYLRTQLDAERKGEFAMKLFEHDAEHLPAPKAVVVPV